MKANNNNERQEEENLEEEPNADDNVIRHKVLYGNFNPTRCNPGSNAELWNNNSNSNSNSNSGDDIFRRISRDIDPTDLVLFMKDNANDYRHWEHRVTPLDMFHTIANKTTKSITISMSNNNNNNNTTTTTNNNNNNTIETPVFPWGLSCGSILTARKEQYHFTNWAHRSIIWAFLQKRYAREQYNVNNNSTKSYSFHSGHRPMGAWIQHLAISNVPQEPLGLWLRQPQPLRFGLRDRDHDDHEPVFSEDYSKHVVEQFDATFQGPSAEQTKSYHAPDLVPVCYGGVFVTQWGQLSSSDAPITIRGWRAITHALSRGDNIEEGHYMERWWGDILSWSSYTSSRKTANENANANENENANSWKAPWASKRSSRRNRRNTVLSEAEQTSLLKYKAKHRTFNTPWAGVILLDTARRPQSENEKGK